MMGYSKGKERRGSPMGRETERERERNEPTGETTEATIYKTLTLAYIFTHIQPIFFAGCSWIARFMTSIHMKPTCEYEVFWKNLSCLVCAQWRRD